MVYRKLDQVPREMCATADEDLRFRKYVWGQSRYFELRKGEIYRMLGKSGRWLEGGKVGIRTSMTLSVMSLPLPNAKNSACSFPCLAKKYDART